MKNTKAILFALILLLNGCTKTVYVAPTPCETECAPCQDTICQEVKNLTKTETYYVEDMPKEKVDYSNLATGKIKRCKTVCRQKKIEK